MQQSIRSLTHAMLLGAAATPLGAQVLHNPAAPPAAPAEVQPAAPAEHAYFGVMAEPISAAMRHHLPMLKPGVGLRVGDLRPDGPAAAAGIGQSDILVRWKDQLLVHPAQLEVLVANATPGDKVVVEYLRRGAMAKAEVTLAARPAGLLPPAGPGRGFHFQQGPDGKSLRLDIDFGQLEETLRNINPEDLLRNIDLEALIRELDLERRLWELENTVRELDLENRLNELMGALQSLNLEGIGRDGILGLLQELNRPQAPPPVEPGAAPEAPAPRSLPDLLQQIDPNTLRDTAKALDLENVDPALIEGVLQKLNQDGLDPETLRKAAASLGIENVDPKLIDEAMKSIDPALINGLLESFGRKAPAAPPAAEKEAGKP